jgi:hypothetical protein
VGEGQPVIAAVRQKDTSVAGCHGTRRAYCLRSLVAIHHSRGAVFLCGTRQRLDDGVSPPLTLAHMSCSPSRPDP